MKLIKSIVVAIVLTFASASYAIGVEELCQKSAEVDVRLKNVLNEDPSYLYVALETSVKGASKKDKADFRERIYFVYNRRNMSDEYIERMSFLNCLIRLK